MPKLVRQLILFGAPLLVGVINCFHPVHLEMTGAYRALAPHQPWWTVLHLFNLVGFPLLGLAVFLLVRDVPGRAAMLSRVFIAVYVPFYVGLDALAGLGTGMLIQHAQALPADQLGPVESAVDVLWGGGITFACGVIGSIAYSIAMYSAAIAFTDKGRRLPLAIVCIGAFAVVGWGMSNFTFGTAAWWIAVAIVGAAALALGSPRGPSALLILSAMFFGTLHVPPYGPLGMLCFLAAAVWLTVGASQRHRPVMGAAAS